MTINATWTQVSGASNITQIAVPRGRAALWGLAGNQQGANVYVLTGPTGQWELVTPGLHLTSIAVHGDFVWGVDATSAGTPPNYLSNIWMFMDGQWIQPIGGCLTAIAFAADGDIWGCNAIQPRTDACNTYRYVGGDWVGVAGQYLTDVAVGTDGFVWGVDTSLNPDVYQYTGTLGSPWEVQSTGQTFLQQIDIGVDNSAWGVDGSNNLYVLVEGQGFQQVSGSAVWVAASDVNNVYRVDTDGSLWRTGFPQLTLSLSVDDALVYEATYDAPTPSGQALGGAERALPSGPGVALEVTDERWIDPGLEKGQAQLREELRGPAATPVGDVTTAEAIEIAKFAWQILKDGQPTWTGPHHTQSSVLSPQSSNWLLYGHAVPGATPTVTAQWKNGFGWVVGRAGLRLAGTYHATALSEFVSPGYYLPDVHFDFSESRASWGFHLGGDAQISSVSNLGGNTVADPVNPSVTLIATLQISSFLCHASKTFYFTATGRSGFVLGPS